MFHTFPSLLDELSALIDPACIERALAVTGKSSIRRPKLPAEHAVWLVIGPRCFAIGRVAGRPETPSLPRWMSAARSRCKRAGPPAPGQSAACPLIWSVDPSLEPHSSEPRVAAGVVRR